MQTIDEKYYNSLNRMLEEYIATLQNPDPSFMISADPEPTRLTSNISKLHSLTQTQELLLNCYSRFFEVVDKAPYAIAVVKQSLFLHVNKPFLHIFQYDTNDEIVGKSALLVVAPEDKERVKVLYQRRIIGIPVIDDYEFTAIKKDGTNFEGNLRVNKVEFDQEEAFVYIITDITEKKRIEQALINNEKKYRLLAENSKDVIWVLGLDGRFTYVSPSVYDLRGYTPEEVLNQSLDQAVTPESLQMILERMEMLKEYFKANIKFLDSPVDEIEQFRKDGSKVWTEVVTKVIYDAEDKPVSILGVSRNIEERKKTESALLKYAEDLKLLNTTKDKFFSIIAHDLKNPFNALLGLSDYLIEDYASLSDEEKINIITEIHKVSKRSYGLLENLLTWSRCQTGTLQPEKTKFDLNTSILNGLYLLSGLYKNKNIQVEKAICDNIEAFADKEMIETVIRNLLTNAVKFTHPGGNVRIECQQKDSFIVISVTDNGIGISDEMLPALFSVDVPVSQKGTSNESGSGLGLILCKEFVERNGGSIWVESKIGQGSKFSFSVPAA